MPSSALDDLGIPQPLSETPAAAPASAAASPPPLPQESDPYLLARTALAEGDPDNPQSWQNVAGVVLNRAAKSGQSVASVLAQPGGFEAYGNGRIQAVDEKSPQFQQALAAIQPVISGQVKVPYDSFYQPDIVARRQQTNPSLKPPFDPSTGTKIGTQLFGNGYTPPASSGSALDDLGIPPAFAGPGTASPPATSANAAPVTHIEWNGKTNRYEDANGTPYQAAGIDPTNQKAIFKGPDGVSQEVVVGAPAAPGQVPIQPLDAGTNPSSLSDVIAEENRRAPVAGLAQGFGTFNNDISNLNSFLANRLPYSQADRNYFAQQVADEHAQRLTTDAQYAGNPYYGAGKVAGTIGMSAPFLAATGAALPEVAGGNLFLRGLGLLGRGAIEGGEAGALASGGNDQSLAQNVGTGALAGATLGVGVPAVAGGVRNLFTGDVSPAVADLANTAVNKYDIPLRTGQIRGAAGDRTAAVQDSNDISRLGTGFATNNGDQWRAFSKAVTGTYGDDSGVLSPANMQAARSKIGGQIGAIAQRNTITDADQVMNDIGGVIHNAAQYTTDAQIAPMLKLAQNIGTVVDPPAAAGAPATMSGAAYSKLIAKGGPLDSAQNSSDSAIRTMAGQIRDALDDGFERSVSPSDLADFQNARFQYKNLMTVADIAKKANVEGQISPQLLAGAVNKSFKNRAFSGAGDLGELSDIAQTFMKEPPNSGTAARLSDIVKGWGQAGLAGGGADAILFHNPTQALGVAAGTAGLGAAKLGLNAARGALARSPFMRDMLINGVQPGPVGNAFLRAGNALARPVLIPAGATQTQNLFAGHYGPQALLPSPPVANSPTPP